ncbi:hypothetical protein DZB94_25090 [Bacillus sp. AW]|nr:hypothetical protein DZB94_25090 [Bacillus sp. AW]
MIICQNDDKNGPVIRSLIVIFHIIFLHLDQANKSTFHLTFSLYRLYQFLFSLNGFVYVKKIEPQARNPETLFLF